MSCSPSLNDYSSEDFCNKEELVVFNVPFLYPPGSDIIIRYTLGSRVNATPLDWIGIFQSGFQSTCHPLTFQWVTLNPSHPAAPLERITTFPAKIVQALESKDASYQFAYVSKENMVLGCSQDFMLKHDDTWDMDMRIYDRSAKRLKTRPSDCTMPQSGSWSVKSKSPDLLSAEEEWEFTNQNPVKPDSPSFSDLSDIVILSTSPSKEAAELLFLQNSEDNEKCVLKSFSFSSDESSDAIIEVPLDMTAKLTSEALLGKTCIICPGPVSMLPQDTFSCFAGASADKKPRKVPMKSKIARIQKNTENKLDKVTSGIPSYQYHHSIYSKFKFVDDDKSDNEVVQIEQTHTKPTPGDKKCLIQELLAQDDESAQQISDDGSGPKISKCKKAKKVKTKMPSANNDELTEVSEKTCEVSKKNQIIVCNELEDGVKEVKNKITSKKVVKGRKKQSVSPQIEDSISEVEKSGDRTEAGVEKIKEKLNMKVSRQLERKSKRSAKKCPEPIVTDDEVDNHMKVYSTDASRARTPQETTEVKANVKSVVKREKEVTSEYQAPGEEIMSIKQKYTYSKKGRSKKKKRQQAKLKTQVMYNLEPLFGGAPPEEQQLTVTEVLKSIDKLELINSFVLQDTSDQGFPALPSFNKPNNVLHPPTMQTVELSPELSLGTNAKDTATVCEMSATDPKKCEEDRSNLTWLEGEHSGKSSELKYMNIPAYLLDIMDALPSPKSECDDNALVELKRAIPPHLRRVSLQHFKAKYKLKYSKKHEIQRMKLRGKYLNPCFMECIKDNITESKNIQKNVFVIHNTDTASNVATNNTISFSSNDAANSLVGPEETQKTESGSKFSLPQSLTDEGSLPLELLSEPKEPMVQLEINDGKKLTLSYASVVKKSNDAPENKSSCVIINMHTDEDAATVNRLDKPEKVTIHEFLAEDDQTLDDTSQMANPKPVTTRSAALKTLAKVLKRRTKALEGENKSTSDNEETGSKHDATESYKEDELTDGGNDTDQSKVSLLWPMPCQGNISTGDPLMSLPTIEGDTIRFSSDQESSGLYIKSMAKIQSEKKIVTGKWSPRRPKGIDYDKEIGESTVDGQPSQDDPKAVLDLALATSLVENNFLKEKVTALEYQLKFVEEELRCCNEEARTAVVPVRKSKTVTHRRVSLCKWTDNVKNLVRSNVEIFSLKSKIKTNMMEIMSLENQVNSLKEAYDTETQRVAKANMKWLKMKLKHKDVKAKLRTYEERNTLQAQSQQVKEFLDDEDDSPDYEPPRKKRRLDDKEVSRTPKNNVVHEAATPKEIYKPQHLNPAEPDADSLRPAAIELAVSSSNEPSKSVSDATFKHIESTTESPQYHAQSLHMSRSCTPKFARVKTDLYSDTPVSGWPSSYSSSPPAYLQSLQAYLPPLPAYINTTGTWYNSFSTQAARKQMKQRTSPPHLPLPYHTITSPSKQLFQPCFPYARRKSPFQQPHFCSIQSPQQPNKFQYRSDQSPKHRSPPLLPLPFPHDVQSVNNFRDSSVSPPRQKRYTSRSPSGCNRHLANSHRSNNPHSINFRASMNHPDLHYHLSPGKSVSTSQPLKQNGIFTHAANHDHVIPNVINSHVSWITKEHGSQGAWCDPSENGIINSSCVSMCGKLCGGADSAHKAKACVAPFQARKDLTMDTTIGPPPKCFMLSTGTLGNPGLSNLEQNQRYPVYDTNGGNAAGYSDRSESQTQPSECAGRYEIGKTQMYQDPVLPQEVEIPPSARFQSHFLRNLVKKECPKAQHTKYLHSRDPYSHIQMKTECDYYRQHQTPVPNYPNFSHLSYGATDQRPQSDNVYPYNLFQNGAVTEDQTHCPENGTHNKGNHMYQRKFIGPNYKNVSMTSNRYNDWHTMLSQQFPANFQNEKSMVELNVHGMIGYPRENLYRNAQFYETSVDKRLIEASEANHHIA